MKTQQLHSMAIPGSRFGGGASGAFNAAAAGKSGASGIHIGDDWEDGHSSRSKVETLETADGAAAYLGETRLGRFAHRIRREYDIPYSRNDNLPADTLARYVYQIGSGKPGKVEYKNVPRTHQFGHEYRHAWQHLELSRDIPEPSSPEEVVLLERFQEADAAAFEFGVAVETVNRRIFKAGFESEKPAGFKIFGKLSNDWKGIIGPVENVRDLCLAPEKLKQAMRRAFDLAIAHFPASEGYRKQAEKKMGDPVVETKKARVSGLARLFFKRPRGEVGAVRVYARRGIDPAYVQKLVDALGYMGPEMPGNYLTETKGPAFDSEFYTGINDIQLERRAQAFAVK